MAMTKRERYKKANEASDKALAKNPSKFGEMVNQKNYDIFTSDIPQKEKDKYMDEMVNESTSRHKEYR